MVVGLAFTGSATMPALAPAAGTSPGEILAFGYNYFGQLGNTTNTKTPNPNPVPTEVSMPGASGQVVQVAAGGVMSLALTSTGRLYGFGSNREGQLGPDDGSGNEEPQAPVLIALPDAGGQVVEVLAGGTHSLVRTASGQLFAFGANSFGQLGSSVDNQTEKAKPLPTQVPPPGAEGSIREIAAGQYDSLIVTSTGQLLVFGRNVFGELGTQAKAGTGEASPMPALVSFPEGTTIYAVGRGPASHTLALVADLNVATSSMPAGVFGATYRAQIQASGGTPPYRWSAGGLPPGLSIDPSSGIVSGVPTSPTCVRAPCAPAPSYSLTATVTDAYGIESSRALTIALARAGSAASAPAISAVRQTHRRWREGTRLAHVSARSRNAPLGTTFTFALDQQASVTFTFTGRAVGRRVGKRCLATPKRNRRRHHCTITLTAGALSFAGHTGTNQVASQGRISRSRKLAPGRYTLVITATNASGMRSKPASVAFTIVR
jgi:hypothetical protein